MNYFDWLVFLVCQDDREMTSYQKLFKALFETEFVPIIEHDENRADDGLNLRRTFEDEVGGECDIFGPCSVLEMLVALALRCENDIMYDPDEGDRTGVWFWEMIDNLNLSRMDNCRFDKNEFNRIMKRLNTRTYDADGFGGPFYIAGFRGDMREIELWYQLSYYLSDRFSW